MEHHRLDCNHLLSPSETSWYRFPRREEFLQGGATNPILYQQLRANTPTLYPLYRMSDYLWSRSELTIAWLLDWRDIHAVAFFEDLFPRYLSTYRMPRQAGMARQSELRKLAILRARLPESDSGLP